MSEYTPTTGQIRHGYSIVDGGLNNSWLRVDAEKRFDRWLAEHDAEVAKAERERLAKLVWNEKQLATEAVFKDPINAGLNGHVAGLYRALDVIEDENK